METLKLLDKGKYNLKDIIIVDIIKGAFHSYFIDLEGHLYEVEEIVSDFRFPYDNKKGNLLAFFLTEFPSLYDRIEWYM